MLRLLLLLSVSTMIVGCGEGFRAVTQIDRDFQPIVEKFEYIYGVDVDLNMFYQDLDGNVIGVCRSKTSYREIAVDPEYWDDAKELDRELLVFHELGHCVLDQLVHRNSTLSDGCSGSIMDEYHIGAYCYDKHYDYYIEELGDGHI